MRRSSSLLTLGALFGLLSACTPPARVRIEPSFVDVVITSGDLGTQEAPIAFGADPVSYGITVTTSDVNGSAYPFDGDLTLQVRPGKLSQDDVISLVDGAWSGTVQFEDGFGPTRIWATDEGDRSTDSTRVPGFAAGVSEVIQFGFPTIAEMQATDDHETNQLDGEYAELRVLDREVVIIARDAAGFWVQDVADAPASGGSLYVYTFSRPDDSLAVGAQLAVLNGIDQEYLASTQFSYPTTGVTGATLDVPEAFELTGCDDAEMELVEAGRVSVTNGLIPAAFIEGSEDYIDYLEYGQWPLSFGSCTVYVESASTVPDFFPTEHVGETVAYTTGMVKEIYGKWIIVVVDEADIVAGPSPPPTRRATRRPGRNPVRDPNKSSRRQYYPEFP